MSPDTVSYFVYEDAMVRFERHIKRQWIAILILLAALILTNAGWIYYEAQFEDIAVTQEADSGRGGNASITDTNIGDIYYGESKTND